VHHEIGAEVDGTLERRAAHAVVDRKYGARLASQFRECRDVGDLADRIRGRLDEEKLRARSQGGTPRVQVARVDPSRLHAEAGEDLVEEGHDGTEHAPGDDGVVARRKQAHRGGGNRRHAG
jgi:hypothetical protein